MDTARSTVCQPVCFRLLTASARTHVIAHSWFDGRGNQRQPRALTPERLQKNYAAYYDSCFELVRKTSPHTLILPYRGDVCTSTGSLYMNNGPKPNSSNSGSCGKFTESGRIFHPTEMHGITMQEGFDGNTDAIPTSGSGINGHALATIAAALGSATATPAASSMATSRLSVMAACST